MKKIEMKVLRACDVCGKPVSLDEHAYLAPLGQWRHDKCETARLRAWRKRRLERAQGRNSSVELSDWQYFTCPSCSRHARMEVLADFNDGTWVVCEFCSEEAQPVMLTRKVLAIDRLQAVHEFVERVNKRAEANMAFTGKLEGSHHLAIQQELTAMELSEKG